MIEETNDEKVKDNMQGIGKKLLESLNFFTIWQAVWLIEMYYLGANAIYNLMINFSPDSINIPENIIGYNQIILGYFVEYEGLIIYLSITLVVCGVCMLFLKCIPKICNYMLVCTYADYGIRCGIWLFLIWVVYKTYLSLEIFFILTPLVVCLLCEAISALGKVVKEKTGITFGEKDY